MSTEPAKSKRAGRFLRLAPGFAVLALGIHLISNQFAITAVKQPLGPVMVVAAIEPEPIEPGPAILHLQLSLSNDSRPIENGSIAARLLGGSTPTPLRVTGKAVSGAFEVALEIAPAGVTRLEVDVSAGQPIGTLEYALEPKQASPRVLRVNTAQ